MPFADNLFESHIKYHILVDKLGDHLVKSIGLSPYTAWTKDVEKIPFEDWSFDYYDSSFELKDVASGYEYPPSALEYMAKLGFERCWVNYVTGSAEYGEFPRGKYYILKKE